MALPRFVGITGDAGATANTRAAAALYALNIPLDTAKSLTTLAGDGVRGVSITWHFAKYGPNQESSEQMVRAWDDRQHAASFPDCPLVNIKQAFLVYAEIARSIKERTIEVSHSPAPFLETPDAKMAACMVKLGHPISGVAYRDGRYWFRFAQAAAVDFAVWASIDPHREKHPDTLLHQLWCAFDCHTRMIDFLKRSGPQFAAVQHRDRTAYIGRDMEQRQIDQLEKLLYRK